MTVTYFINETSRYFSFSRKDVNDIASRYRDEKPCESFLVSYGGDSLMYPFLDAMLSPSDILEFRSLFVGGEFYFGLTYDVGHIPPEDLAAYFDFNDDLPF